MHDLRELWSKPGDLPGRRSSGAFPKRRAWEPSREEEPRSLPERAAQKRNDERQRRRQAMIVRQMPYSDVFCGAPRLGPIPSSYRHCDHDFTSLTLGTTASTALQSCRLPFRRVLHALRIGVQPSLCYNSSPTDPCSELVRFGCPFGRPRCGVVYSVQRVVYSVQRVLDPLW